MKQLIFSLIILTTLISCKNESQKFTKIDENFEIFLTEFSKDSLFQISRVKFPLEITELNDDFEPFEKKLDINEYRKIDLRYDDSLKNRQYDKYTQKIELIKDKAKVEIRGIDNGIMTDVFFQKIEEKWTLIGWNDSST